MKPRSVVLFLLVFMPMLAFNQENRIDSLYSKINSEKRDTNAINNYASLINELQNDNQASRAYEESIKAFQAAEQIGFLRGQVKIAYHAGNSAIMISNYPEAMKYYQFVIDNADKINNQKIKSSAISNLGNAYVRQGDFKKGMDYLLAALKIKEEMNETRGILIARMNIGNLYGKMQLDKKALEEYRKCEKLALELDNSKALVNTYINLANVFVNLKQHDSAEVYYSKATLLAKQNNDKLALLSLYGNIGLTATDQGEYKKAEEYLLETLKLSNETGQLESLANTYSALASLYLKTDKNQKALEYAGKSLEMSRAVGSKVYERDAHKILYSVNKALGKSKEALINYERYTQINDSIIGEENQKQIARKEMEFEYQKKEALLNAEREKETAIAAEEKRKQQLILWSVCGILAVALLFSVIIYRSYRDKQKINSELAKKNTLIRAQKNIVEEKQKEILDSILYAEQIQKTLIANHDFVNETIPDSFVMYRPKDIVSGDFYWATERDGKFYLAVCDSTGHGVPGAFMSLLNISFLNEAINIKFLSDPAQIFEHVRKRLIESISQHGRKDGMDGVLVCFDKTDGQIRYCAANNNPVLVSNEEVINLPNDKMPVGKGDKENHFITHTINSTPGSMLYLFTDGYPDQFGGDKGKKFKYKQLQETFLDLYKYTSPEQKQIIENKFDDWKGKLEQIDDVCLVGIRL